jgi:beta-hydroxylase
MFFDPQRFDFVPTLEANWQVVREELLQLDRKYFIPWPERMLYGRGWDVFGLYAFEKRFDRHCAWCPETTRLVEAIPGMTTAGFSSLLPGVHIKPHKGLSSAVLRCHLGLIVPLDCALRVGDDTRPWQEGKCLVFDDTTEHEAWNRSAQERIVLLLDFRRPADLREKEEVVSCPGFLQPLVRSLGGSGG